ncbi:ATP-binding protein [Paenibacillus selenitireducens]|uniref:ATP-binding protein n=1 Tax=Paenibacillus selenitireducens TaxID=1324314 RepID=UPI0011812B2E|nr:ATP-binding protein [Paenibacillus selenitireducens]
MSVELQNHVAFETVLQHLDSGVLLFDSRGNICFTNQEMTRLLETSEEVLIGCSLLKLFRDQRIRRDFRSHMVHITKHMLRRKIQTYELVETNRHWLITRTNIKELDGYCLLTIKDVSQYKEVEQTAFAQDKLAMLGQIAAAIAHEIRNPLTAIRGFIQLLRPYLKAVGKEEYSRIILAEIDRANDIIVEFLDSSKPTKPEKTCIPIRLLLKDVVMLAESEALMRGCEIRFSEQGILDSKVSIDVKQMKQVILNLVKNAMDAICDSGKEEPGMIDLSLENEGEQLQIIIRDNGKGMNKLSLKRLFDPFYTTKATGTGIGLSVSERIIKNHGGSISVDSQLGLGTEFIISLPKATG